MASAERDYNSRGSGGGAPSGGPGDRALGGSSGGGAKPSETECLFCFRVSKESCKFVPLLVFAKVSKSHSE